jgi:class 3 adenylate cyclase
MGDSGGVVAILFTDVVASTEVLDGLGDDAAEVLRKEHFVFLRRAVAEADGTEVLVTNWKRTGVTKQPLATEQGRLPNGTDEHPCGSTAGCDPPGEALRPGSRHGGSVPTAPRRSRRGILR